VIANARMYSVSPEVGELWRALLAQIIAKSGLPIALIDHAEPAPIDELWRRTDQGAVFMCGLPFSRAEPQPTLIAAPVPSPAEFGGEARYWSDFVVREDSAFRAVSDTYGGRIAFTVPGSQSGCVAALSYFMSAQYQLPLFREIIAPTVTPLGALSAVIRGIADIAPIDAYALRLLARYRPDLTSQVRIIGQTAPTPIPPLVASSRDLGALSAAFLEAHQSASIKGLMEQLLLQRFARPDSSAYTVLRERFETAVGYWNSHRLAAATHPAFAL
jgi:ABC-type phosphate/phosphonate transport system substrate-binding protein